MKNTNPLRTLPQFDRLTPAEKKTATRHGYVGVFASRSTLNSAGEFACQVLDGQPSAIANLAALGVLANTYAIYIATL